MSENFSTILDEALTRLEAGEPVEVILDDYASQRDELAPLLDAALGFSSLRTAPATQVDAGLAAFLDEARAPDSEKLSPKGRRRWLVGLLATLRELWWSPRTRMLAGTLVALTLLLALLGGTFGVAADSLPGDWIYPVKLVAEQVRLVFVSGPEGQVEHHLQRVQTRVGEIERLSRLDRPISAATLARLDQSLDAGLLAAASAELVEIPHLLVMIERATEEQVRLLQAEEADASSARAREAIGQARLSLGRVWAVVRAGKTDVQTFLLNAQLGSFFVDW